MSKMKVSLRKALYMVDDWSWTGIGK